MAPLIVAWVAFGLFTIGAGVLVALHADRLSHRRRLGVMATYFEHVLELPLAFHTFGGWKKSAFGDTNQHGPEGVKFYTKIKTVTARWPTGIRSGAEFNIPTMK